ncbi:MAG: hypothetical protein ACR2G3_09970 [Solirubrobacterales bacterium]
MTGATDDIGRGMAEHEALLSVLAGHGVDFLIVGGLAVTLHGYIRATLDLDIVPSPDAGNLKRLARALRELEAEAIGARGERLPLDTTDAESLAVGNYFLDTKHGALDLFNGPAPDLKRYRRLDASAIRTDIAGSEVKVVSKADLLAMKREAGRPKDLSDIAALTEVERSSPEPG